MYLTIVGWLANSGDPDQTPRICGVWSESARFARTRLSQCEKSSLLTDKPQFIQVIFVQTDQLIFP